MRKSSPLVFTFCVLVGINTMNFFDRQVLSAVQEKIRKDWNLSDTELGWLGTAFILLYAVVGVPLGRLADRWNRRWLLAAGVALWSAMTFVSGFAWGFWSLFVFRLAVGIGEATCAPTASSLIGDLIPAQRRARAMSIFMLGLPLGLALSFFVSGAVAKYHGWQAAFFVAGIPGLLLAVAALFILDPVRGGAERTRRTGRAIAVPCCRAPRAKRADNVVDHCVGRAPQLQHVRAGHIHRVISHALSRRDDRSGRLRERPGLRLRRDRPFRRGDGSATGPSATDRGGA